MPRQTNRQNFRLHDKYIARARKNRQARKSSSRSPHRFNRRNTRNTHRMELQLKEAFYNAAASAGIPQRKIDIAFDLFIKNIENINLLTDLSKKIEPESQQKSDNADELSTSSEVDIENISNSLPKLPDGLQWPTEKYDVSREFGKRGGIIKFLSRVWIKLIHAKVVTRPILATVDPSAEKAVRNYIYNGGKHRTLPKAVYIPSKPELTDIAAEAYASPGDRPARVDWALRKRLSYAKKIGREF